RIRLTEVLLAAEQGSFISSLQKTSGSFISSLLSPHLNSFRLLPQTERTSWMRFRFQVVVSLLARSQRNPDMSCWQRYSLSQASCCLKAQDSPSRCACFWAGVKCGMLDQPEKLVDSSSRQRSRVLALLAGPELLTVLQRVDSDLTADWHCDGDGRNQHDDNPEHHEQVVAAGVEAVHSAEAENPNAQSENGYSHEQNAKHRPESLDLFRANNVTAVPRNFQLGTMTGRQNRYRPLPHLPPVIGFGSSDASSFSSGLSEECRRVLSFLRRQRQRKAEMRRAVAQSGRSAYSGPRCDPVIRPVSVQSEVDAGDGSNSAVASGGRKRKIFYSRNLPIDCGASHLSSRSRRGRTRWAGCSSSTPAGHTFDRAWKIRLVGLPSPPPQPPSPPSSPSSVPLAATEAHIIDRVIRQREAPGSASPQLSQNTPPPPPAAAAEKSPAAAASSAAPPLIDPAAARLEDAEDGVSRDLLLLCLTAPRQQPAASEADSDQSLISGSGQPPQYSGIFLFYGNVASKTASLSQTYSLAVLCQADFRASLTRLLVSSRVSRVCCTHLKAFCHLAAAAEDTTDSGESGDQFLQLLSGRVLDLPLAHFLLEPDKPLDDVHSLLLRHLPGRGSTPAAVGSLPVWEQVFVLRSVYFFGLIMAAFLIGRLWWRLERRLQQAGMLDLFTKLESPLVPLIYLMERTGAAGETFCINSPLQLKNLLYSKLRLHEQLTADELQNSGLTKAVKDQSTKQEVLMLMAPKHPLPAQVVAYRRLHRTISVCCVGYQEFVETDGRIRPVWDQRSAVTGRLYSSLPNLQGLP
uniref:POLAc domain-containing protein n=1 Tax=Macrostomum lignano TaxID=282301 RepID=A0A1I8FPL6_9PLAT